MAQAFQIRYFDPARGTVIEESTLAESELKLRRDVAALGRVLLTCQQRPAVTASKALGQPEFDVAWWCRELGTLVTAGMTVVEALETLQLASRGGAHEQINAAVLRSLREGQALSKALRGTGAFPAVLVAGVTASERTSTLTAALNDFLRYDEMLRRLRRQIVSAAIYPMLVLALGALVVTLLLAYVIPRFSRMYADVHGAVSAPTQALLFVSHGVVTYWPWLLTVLIAIAAFVMWAMRRGLVGIWSARALHAIGPLDRQWDHYRRARLYQSLDLMFRGGYTLDEALSVCESLGLGERMTASIAGARSQIARGRTASAALSEHGIADRVAERLLAVGERSGEFHAVLQTIADRHAQAFATFIERSTRIIEPLLLLAIALLVGGIVVMMYLPIFDIASSIR